MRQTPRNESRPVYPHSHPIVANGVFQTNSLAWAELYLTTYAVFSRFNLQLFGTTQDDVTVFRSVFPPPPYALPHKLFSPFLSRFRVLPRFLRRC